MKNVSTEDYLSVIYKNQNEAGEIKSNIIADKLSISNAAVTDMVKKLSKEGLINYIPYKGISLTDEGNSYAKALVRRHRIWELFLFQIVGLPWEKVHDEAEKLEHCASDELINRMEEMLNFPEFDPHGDPIPDKHGRIPKRPDQFPLTKAEAGAVVSVQRVNDSDNAFLAHISNLGIDLKSEISVKEVISYDGSMVAECNGNTFTISQKTASNIFVETAKNREENSNGH